ncbi:hypothetical protein [Streptomyces sp. NPDC127084]|uniref:hypothetical protein n=1 Tax=Streptomyces sp. NPDC127084 TaxID=3347133 RepID=UPI00366A2A76
MAAVHAWKGAPKVSWPAAEAAPVRVEVDYSSFRGAYGGDCAARLRLVELRACALTTPDQAKCRIRKPVPTWSEVRASKLSTPWTDGTSTGGWSEVASGESDDTNDRFAELGRAAPFLTSGSAADDTCTVRRETEQITARFPAVREPVSTSWCGIEPEVDNSRIPVQADIPLVGVLNAVDDEAVLKDLEYPGLRFKPAEPSTYPRRSRSCFPKKPSG